MGSLNRKLNSSTCSSLLLWSAVLLWLGPSLRLRLMPTPLCSMELTELMELMAMASPTPDMAMEPTPMPTTERGLLMLRPTPMEPMPTERGLLMPSPRLMLLFSTELTDMLDMAMVPTPTPMVPTPMPTERGLLMPSLRLMLMPTPMPTDMASKKSTNSNQSRPPSTNAEAQKQTK